MDLEPLIRTIPDYPKPGILFRDITTLLTDSAGFRATIEQLEETVSNLEFDAVAGMEARGFIVGAALAFAMKKAFIPLRKKGKLPAEIHYEEYQLEYGVDRLEVHKDALKPNARVLLVDDLIATGGTAIAALKLINKCDATVVGCRFIIDLPDLKGMDKIKALGIEDCKALLAYPGH